MTLQRALMASEENVRGVASEKFLPKKRQKKKAFHSHSPLDCRLRRALQLKSSGSYLSARGKHLKKKTEVEAKETVF